MYCRPVRSGVMLQMFLFGQMLERRACALSMLQISATFTQEDFALNLFCVDARLFYILWYVCVGGVGDNRV